VILLHLFLFFCYLAHLATIKETYIHVRTYTTVSVYHVFINRNIKLTYKIYGKKRKLCSVNEDSRIARFSATAELVVLRSRLLLLISTRINHLHPIVYRGLMDYRTE